MQVVSDGKNVIRCDGCAKHQSPVDVFTPFVVSWPVGVHPITGEPVVRFIYERTMPKTPVLLHACIDCARRIRSCLKRGKVDQLPDGPLRKALRDALANPENRAKAFNIHFIKGSALARA